MRHPRTLILTLMAAPLLLAGCMSAPPAEQDPEPTPPPPPSESAEEPEGDGQLTISIDGEPIESAWVDDVECSYSDGTGSITNFSDEDTDYIAASLVEQGDEIQVVAPFFADGDLELFLVDEPGTATIEGGQISATIAMTSDHQDSRTLEIEGPCDEG